MSQRRGPLSVELHQVNQSWCRLSDNTETRMVGHQPTPTSRVELVNGKRMVEATDLLQENDIKVLMAP